jgi:diguanylate cyclase (GGDEF)-like protein
MARPFPRRGGLLLVLTVLAAGGLAPQPAGGAPGAATPPLVAIADLLGDADQNTVPDALNGTFRVRGTVSAGNAALQLQNYQLLIHDDSGGISLYARGRRFPDLDPGTVVEAGGQLGQFRGAPQLFIDALEVVGTAALPAPLDIPVIEADSWQHMGRRVRVEGLAGPLTLEGHARLRLDGDDGSAVQLYIPQPVMGDFRWEDYPRGSRLAVIGVVSIYKQTWPYDGGFQLVVTRPADLQVLAPPLPAWLRWGLWAALPLAALVVLGLLLVALLQRRQRQRQQELATLSALSAAFSQAELDAAQLARRAADTLTAYGVVEAVCIHLRDAAGEARCVALSTDQPEHQRQLEAAVAQAPSAALEPAPQLAAAGLRLRACHPLPSGSDTAGWLSLPQLRRRRLTPMQQRILQATVKLLALALENRRIREQAASERAALHQLAVTDDLTGLYNRRFLDEYLRVQIPQAQRRGSGLAFLALDIDHFKPINDRFGHPVGDAVLRRLASLLRELGRSSDLPVRIGGEEFLILAAETHCDGAMQLAERLRAGVETLNFTELGLNPPLQISVSIGVAVFGPHGTSAEALLKASDEALYAAKHAGRNQVRLAAATPEPPTERDQP